MPQSRILFTSAFCILHSAFCTLPAAHGQAVTLQYKLQPGHELQVRETVEVTEKISVMEKETTSTATAETSYRAGVVDVDTDTGMMLIGYVGTVKITTKTSDAEGPTSLTRDERKVGVIRIDRTGRPAQREIKVQGPARDIIKTLLQPLGQLRLNGLYLPTRPVKVGDSWESPLGLSVARAPLACKTFSTLAETRKVEGVNCAIIKSRIQAAESDDKLPSPVVLNGDVEGTFDIDRGMFVTLTANMRLQVQAPGRKNVYTSKAQSTLQSLRQLPARELAEYAKRIRPLDAAIGNLYDGETQKAVTVLERLATAETRDDWKPGIEKILGVAKQIKQLGARSQPAGTGIRDFDYVPANRADKLFLDAEGAADEGEWKKAAETYMAFVREFPRHRLVSSALADAGRIYSEKLKDATGLAEVKKTLLILVEKALAAKAGDPFEMYKLAYACQRLEEPATAVRLYLKFATAGSDSIQPRLRILAQFRSAGLLAKLGRKKEALAAYRAVETIPADPKDDYVKQIKASAKEKAAELGDAKE